MQRKPAHHKHTPYQKQEGPQGRHEQYHFAKHKRATFFTPNVTSNNTLTTTQLAILSLALLYTVQHTIQVSAAPLHPSQTPHTHQPQANFTNLTLAPKTSHAMTLTPLVSIARHFHGFPVTDITHAMTNCESKSVGTSSGKICYINNKKYMLKNAHDNTLFFLPGKKYLAARYAHTLLKDYIGIRVPNIYYAHEKSDSLYLASEFIDDFVKIGDTFSEVDYALFGTENWFSFRYHMLTSYDLIKQTFSTHIRSKVSELEIAKLVVAGTFVDDLINNEGNWGMIDDRLVVVDMDSRDAIISDARAAASSIRNLPIHLSLTTILSMREIYKNMLSNPAPKVNDDIDLSQEDYEALIKSYDKACKLAIERIIDDSDINLYQPSEKINEVLSQSFLDVSKKSCCGLFRF